MPANDIRRWFSDLLEQLGNNRQRQLVVLQGSEIWGDKQLDALARIDPGLLLISDRRRDRESVPLAAADGLLGSEARIVVLDLFTGLNADVVCIAAGLVHSGGVLVLLSPAVADWSLERDDYAIWQDRVRSTRPWFIEYFFNALADDDEIGLLVGEGAPLPMMPDLELLEPTEIVAGQTEEQAARIDAVVQWLQTARSGIALLSAPRGRGKSTCLGQLVGRLVDKGLDVRVTASSKRAAAQLLHWAPEVEFEAPDSLVLEPRALDLLFIDEAAMIPQSLLRQLRQIYPRIVMASTEDGYEGTGQGFRLRFINELAADEFLKLDLSDPVRWCNGDRLEAWINRTLMLASRLQAPQKKESESVQLQLVESPGDPENLALTRKVYELLVAAHYRTRPSDLRMLMENPELVLLVARVGDRVLGAALLNPEGGFDASLCEKIFLGQRRPRGHLLAQMLTAQAGSRYFASKRGLRVQRIAVAPEQRRAGLGRRLVELACEYALSQSYAYLGASFSLNRDNAGFWQQTGFSLVHVSYAQGKSSGRHSIAVLRALDGDTSADIDTLRTRMQRQLPVWMTQFLQTMEAEQVVALLRYCGFCYQSDEVEKADIEAFCEGNKGFELCFASLQPYVMHCVAQSQTEPDRLLIEKAVQNRAWQVLRRDSGSEGRKQLQQRLRGLVAALNKAC